MSLRRLPPWFRPLLAAVGAAMAASASEPGLEQFPPCTTCAPTVPVFRIATGGVLHRFFDTSPVSPSGRYVALFRLPVENRGPRPGEAGEVFLVDLQTGRERTIAQSRGFEMQVGANVQWGPTDAELYFNDVDPATWAAFAVQMNPLTGANRRLEGTVFMVSPDGRQLASHHLINSPRAQVGYGVIVPEAVRPPRNIGPVADDGVYLTEVTSGRCRRLVSIREIYEQARPSIAIPHPDDFEYYCFQVKWNPQGTRLLTTVQWSPRVDRAPPGSAARPGRHRAVITMRPDGSDLRTAITPEQWARGGHHVNWLPDGEHLSMNLNVDGRPGLELISVRADGTELKILFQPGSGHPSLCPDGWPLFITDAYPDEPVAAGDGTSPLRLLDPTRGTEETIAKIFVSMTAGELRVDPHPAWDRTGRFVVFNGFVGGTRNVFLADLAARRRR